VSESFGIAVVGCGRVGGATALLLQSDSGRISVKAGAPIELVHVVDVDFTHGIEIGIEDSFFTSDVEAAIADPAVRCVVELIGGTTFARTVIEKALIAGKHVVTANKALLAMEGASLFALARLHGVTISFEASCGGAIPIVRALYDGLVANRIDALYGILNGTCNYILTAMNRHGESYSNALALAQEHGLVEADPSLDVSGGDTAHKLTILGSLAFGKRIDLDKIPVEGIDTLEPLDVAFGSELGYVVKLLAIAQRRDNGVSLRVRPSFIGTDHPLAWVSGSFNALSIYGSSAGHTMYYGRGAGGTPTASAIAADIVQIAIGSYQPVFGSLSIWADLTESAVQLPVDQIESRFYIRVTVEDKPGVLARISSILGNHEISVSAVIQRESESEADRPAVPVVITTHMTTEGRVRAALEEIEAETFCVRSGVCIGIIDEHEESI